MEVKSIAPLIRSGIRDRLLGSGSVVNIFITKEAHLYKRFSFMFIILVATHTAVINICCIVMFILLLYLNRAHFVSGKDRDYVSVYFQTVKNVKVLFLYEFDHNM